MIVNHKRRSKLVGFTIQQHSWDLETARSRYRGALEDLSEADKAVREIEAVIEKTEASLRRAFNEEIPLDLTAVQAARHFLAETQALYRGRVMDQQRVVQRVRQAEVQLRELVLYIKALNQVKSKSDNAVRSDLEKKLFEQNVELWLQRYGKNEWKKYR